MHKITFDQDIEFEGKKFRINNPNGCKGCFVGILDRIVSQLSAILSHHCKVFVCMEIFPVTDYSADNELFSKFIKKYTKRLRIRFGLSRVGYVWVREQGVGEAQHYHLVLFLDGNKVNFHHNVFKIAEEMWTARNQPRPAFPPLKSYYNLTRCKWPEFGEVIYHLSYMAKVRTKENKPLTANRYEGSRHSRLN
jgi:hypothetical protein